MRSNNFVQSPEQGRVNKAIYGDQHKPKAQIINSHQQYQVGGEEDLEYDRQENMVQDMRAPGGQRVPIESQNEVVLSPRHLYVPQQRIVHLDLKGAPPSIHYLKKVLTMSKGLGATGVLVEWEDMFPWSGR